MDVDMLPADGRAAGLARRVIRDRLREWDLEDLEEVTLLLTSELIANVIVHTGSAPSLEVTRDGGGVRVTVTDASPVPPRRRWHSATATTGRGVQLLQDLADDWGWRPAGSGKAVWFVLRRGRDPWSVADRQPEPSRPEAPGRPPSPLGRYDLTPPGSGTLVPVVLLGVPVRVLAAGREHHDGLLRELRLLALSGSLAEHDAPVRLIELTQELGMRFAAARSRPDAEVDRALEQGLDTVDLTYRVPPEVVDGVRRLEALLAEADEFCRSAQLITLARSPLLVRFASWYSTQFVDQVAGRPATRWDGPLDPDRA